MIGIYYKSVLVKTDDIDILENRLQRNRNLLRIGSSMAYIRNEGNGP